MYLIDTCIWYNNLGMHDQRLLQLFVVVVVAAPLSLLLLTCHTPHNYGLLWRWRWACVAQNAEFLGSLHKWCKYHTACTMSGQICHCALKILGQRFLCIHSDLSSLAFCWPRSGAGWTTIVRSGTWSSMRNWSVLGVQRMQARESTNNSRYNTYIYSNIQVINPNVSLSKSSF